MALFRDRQEAGRLLADALRERGGYEGGVVLGLPRGGVPVAAEVARQLGLELDVFVVRKLGFPGQPEYAMGALASGGVVVLNPELEGHIPREVLDRVTRLELEELERREHLYRTDHHGAELSGRPAILVDDGLATGSTMRAAVQALRKLGPSRVIMAVPVAAPESIESLRPVVDDAVSVATPDPFVAVSAWYQDFSQTSDDEVRALLDASRRPTVEGMREMPARVQAGRATLQGDLAIPAAPRGVVLFAHGSGSSRHSPRNRYVASELQRGGLATLLMDLLTVDEEELDRHTGHLRFNIGFLADRLVSAIRWVSQQPGTRAL
ncbi:MAG: phosphoribosyltransferase family protein, partial [Myxococcota bacterium]